MERVEPERLELATIQSDAGFSVEDIVALGGDVDSGFAVTSIEFEGETIAVGVNTAIHRTPEAIEAAVDEAITSSVRQAAKSAQAPRDRAQVDKFETIRGKAERSATTFDSVELRGDPDRIDSVIALEIGSKVDYVLASNASPVPPQKELTRSGASSATILQSVPSLEEPVTELQATSARWSPNWFDYQTWQESSTARWGWLQFAWDYDRLYNLHWGFSNTNVTFEPDFVTYNYDGQHYFSPAASKVSYWNSNMPCANFDTDAFDSNNELVYTIGCNDAHKLNPNVKYFTHFKTMHGNSGVDSMKILAQAGERRPSLCCSRWCVYSVASDRYPNSGWKDLPATNVQ